MLKALLRWAEDWMLEIAVLGLLFAAAAGGLIGAYQNKDRADNSPKMEYVSGPAVSQRYYGK